MKFEEIKELIEIFGESTLSQLKIKEKDFSIELGKAGVDSAPAAMPVEVKMESAEAPKAMQTVSTEEPTAVSAAGELITSPMVGTFYAAPSPDSPPFVQAGDTVRKGQTLCILEAMKIMNELEAEYDCKILEVLVQDGEPVEYDKPLFRVEKI